MTDHRKIIELIPAYALHALDEDEAQLVDAHLKSCQSCRNELAAYEETTARLATTVALEEPPDYLKSRLMERVKPAPQPASTKSYPSWWEQVKAALQISAPVWAPVSAILILVLLISNIILWRQANLPGNHEIVTVGLVGTDAAPDANGVMVLTSGQPEGILVVTNLTPLSDEQQYQLWLIEEDGSRDSGGVFSVDSSGRAEIHVAGGKALPDYTAFGITIEPAGGSPGPTGPKVLGSEL